jgi:Phage integrase, N-terminal SAM-like domain
MKAFAAKWEEDYVTVQVRLKRMKESSAESCRSRLRLHVVSFFGHMRVDAITLTHVREFWRRCWPRSSRLRRSLTPWWF